MSSIQRTRLKLGSHRNLHIRTVHHTLKVRKNREEQGSEGLGIYQI